MAAGDQDHEHISARSYEHSVPFVVRHIPFVLQAVRQRAEMTSLCLSHRPIALTTIAL